MVEGDPTGQASLAFRPDGGGTPSLSQVAGTFLPHRALRVRYDHDDLGGFSCTDNFARLSRTPRACPTS